MLQTLSTATAPQPSSDIWTVSCAPISAVIVYAFHQHGLSGQQSQPLAVQQPTLLLVLSRNGTQAAASSLAVLSYGGTCLVAQIPLSGRLPMYCFLDSLRVSMQATPGTQHCAEQERPPRACHSPDNCSRLPKALAGRFALLTGCVGCMQAST